MLFCNGVSVMLFCNGVLALQPSSLRNLPVLAFCSSLLLGAGDRALSAVFGPGGQGYVWGGAQTAPGSHQESWLSSHRAMSTWV